MSKKIDLKGNPADVLLQLYDDNDITLEPWQLELLGHWRQYCDLPVSRWEQFKFRWHIRWREWRSIAGEALITLGVQVMPMGGERKKIEECLYEYYLWSKENIR